MIGAAGISAFPMSSRVIQKWQRMKTHKTLYFDACSRCQCFWSDCFSYCRWFIACLTNLRKERFDVSRFNEITGIISAGMGRRLRGYLDYLSCFDAALANFFQSKNKKDKEETFMYSLKRLWLRDQGVYKQWASLMDRAGLNKEEELDYTVGIYDNDLLVATGSYYHNILKCLVVCKAFQSENLLTEIIQHLVDRLAEEGEQHYFLYSKPSNELIFRSLGFQKIIATSEILFMERGLPNFASYLSTLAKGKNGDRKRDSDECQSLYQSDISILSRQLRSRVSKFMSLCYPKIVQSFRLQIGWKW